MFRALGMLTRSLHSLRSLPVPLSFALFCCLTKPAPPCTAFVLPACACASAGHLYCHDCHKGKLSTIPARVLHKWDFRPHPVCCAAHDYLAAIQSLPVLCVPAVNPGLYAR